MYAKEAIMSCLNQNINKNEYECIVVSNIDLDLSDNGPLRIIKSSEESLGAKLAQGIEAAKGEVVSILEDDDLFMPNKLQRVQEVFSRGDVVYYYNNFLPVDRLGRTFRTGFYKWPRSFISNIGELKIKYDRKRENDFVRVFHVGKGLCILNSCVSIKKRAIDLSTLKVINRYYIAEFLFYSALLSGGTLLFDKEILTKYRIHGRNSSLNRADALNLQSNMVRISDVNKIRDFLKNRKFWLGYEMEESHLQAIFLMAYLSGLPYKKLEPIQKFKKAIRWAGTMKTLIMASAALLLTLDGGVAKRLARVAPFTP